jgi:hypothetical protein
MDNQLKKINIIETIIKFINRKNKNKIDSHKIINIRDKIDTPIIRIIMGIHGIDNTEDSQSKIADPII